MVKRVALMQPYFFPYPRYFRLFAEVDEFIIYDDTQFPKGGRVHRTELPGPSGNTEWLTLPLSSQPLSTLIRDRSFSADATTLFDLRLRRFPWIESACGPAAERVRTHLRTPLTSLLDYLEAGLRLVLDLLHIETKITLSSAMRLDPAVRGQERVIAAVQRAGATHFVNLPGGRALYNVETFAASGITLSFLPSYDGPHAQLLPALMTLPPKDIVL